MPELISRFRSDRNCLERQLSVPYSEAFWARRESFLEEWRSALEALPYDDLSRDDRCDWRLLTGLLDAETRRLAQERLRFAAAQPLLPFAACLTELETRRKQMSDIDAAEIARRLDRMRTEVKTAQGILESDRDFASPTIVADAAEAVLALREMLTGWFEFYNGYDPLFTWWAEKPYRGLDAALESYAIALRQAAIGAAEGAILGAPIGRAALCDELRYAQIAYSPEELIAAARADMLACRTELRLAARAMGCGDDWRAALELVKQDHVAPGAQTALVRDLAHEAIAYVESENLVTVPALARECWQMEMMSAERQKINPFFTGGETISISFPTNDMEHAQKEMSLRGNNRHFARATVHHELIPGHHLQGFCQERYRPYRQIFYTPFWTEGWTLHWEMLLWERGFARTPQEKIGMLFWRQHRCARVIFSLGFHLGEMTAAECVEMLVHEVGHERDNAEAEVRRSFEGGYDPLYQLAYLIGGMQMHSLHRELVHGGRMTDREFHDAVLRENCMPIPTLRALLTGDPLEQDLDVEWKFLG
ncbi:X-Pro dipeptidyl-peptidase [Capsulimonas corticalis]|uniref:X-Pro dipeptidyl-peptidase n=2 Tax=Capsulimonas corticalis TaxID=2219043 RepID=A0A9N7L8V2_9BACT|nr:X-Pro dipeptidyl-peptidase [Capsulimonas corticalis]